MPIRHILIVIAVVFIGMPSFSADIVIRDETLFDRPVKTLDNGLVRVSVTPEIGGRVLAFRLNKGNRKTLHISRLNIHYQPDDMWGGADYGGLTDIATHGWPGAFWALTYDIEKTTYQKMPAVQVQGRSDNVEITRTLWLQPDSTLFHMTVEQTNITDQPRPMSIRIHGEFAVGQCGDNDDVITFTGPNGIERLPYVMGSENPRMSFENPAQGWMAYVDTQEQLALVRRFFPPAENTRVLFWRGHNEGGPERDEKGGFYALDRFMAEQNVLPGQTLQAEEQYFIVTGLAQVDFVAEHVVGSVTFDKLAYAPGDTAVATIRIGGAFADGPYRVSLKQHNAGDSIIPGQPQQVHLPAHQPGSTTAELLRFKTPQQTTSLLFEIRDNNRRIATVSRSIIVDEDGYARAEEILDRAQRLQEQMIAVLSAKQLDQTPQGQSHIKQVSWWIDQLRHDVSRGDVQQVRDRSEAVLKRLQGHLDYVKIISPPDSVTQEQLARLLEEIGQ